MSKSRGQSRQRAIKRGNINRQGISLKRPFNNSKRTKGRKGQIEAENFYFYLKSKYAYLKRMEKHNKLVEEQIKKLDEGISNN